MTGTRRDALDPAERARQAGLPAAARRTGWVRSPDPDGVTVAQELAAHYPELSSETKLTL